MRGRVLPRDVSIAPLQLTDRTLLAESGVASARLSYDTSMLLVAATGRAALTYPLDVSNPIAAINQLAPNVSAPIDAHDVVMTSDLVNNIIIILFFFFFLLILSIRFKLKAINVGVEC